MLLKQMLNFVAALILTGATVPPCPHGAHGVIERSGGQCPGCMADSPPEACRCAPVVTQIRCHLGVSKHAKSPAGEVARPDFLENVVTLGQARLRRGKLREVVANISGNFFYRADGRLYYPGSNLSRPSAPPKVTYEVPDTVKLADELGVTLEQIGTMRFGDRVVAWLKRGRAGLPADAPATMLPLEEAIAPGPFFKSIPNSPRLAYISKEGEMMLADPPAGVAWRLSPEPGQPAPGVGTRRTGGAMSFFAVSEKGIAYLYARENGWVTVHWTDTTSAKDKIVSALYQPSTVVPYIRRNRRSVVLHAQMGAVQTVVLIDVDKGRVTLPIMAMPFWGNSSLSPDGRRFAFSVITHNQQPRRHRLYEVRF